MTVISCVQQPHIVEGQLGLWGGGEEIKGTLLLFALGNKPGVVHKVTASEAITVWVNKVYQILFSFMCLSFFFSLPPPSIEYFPFS